MQKEVATIQKQQALAGKSRAALEKEKEKALREKAKLEEEKRKKEEAALLKPVQTQKVPFGVDPKTVLCVFFKAGNCEKGNKCKFSHDLNVGRKVEKKNLYEDSREDKLKGECPSSALPVTCGVDRSRRHDGELGRGEATGRCHVQERESTDYHGRELRLFPSFAHGW